MNNKLYLISEEDYIKHIDRVMMQHLMLSHLASEVSKLPSNRGNKALSQLAETYWQGTTMIADAMGVSVDYFTFGNREKMLNALMGNELIEPEDAGYFCDDSFCCGNCECCCDGECEDDEDENAEEFEEMMAALSAIVHSIFGDDVTFHITVD